MQNTRAYSGIRSILEETIDAHGWRIPEVAIEYTSRLLSERIDRNPWQPEPSYAERYLSIKKPCEALELGDTCWFTRAVFPELGQRRGITSSYYVQLGQGCYSMALQYARYPAVQLLHDHFEFLAEVAYTAIRHHGEFRSMWD